MDGSTALTLDRESVHYHVRGKGPNKVVMLHGNSQRANTFDSLIATLPAKLYQCFCIDLPGHGDSSSASDPEECYSLPGYAQRLLQVIEAVSLQDAVFVGHSLGGHVLLEAWPDLPSARGLFLMGAPPVANPSDLANAFLPHPAGRVIFQPEMSSEEARAFDTLLFDLPGTDAENIRHAFEITDPKARTLLGASIVGGQFLDERAVVAASKKTIAVLASEQDPIINLDFFNSIPPDRLWRGGVQVIADCGHWPHLQNPKSVSTLLLDYLKDCHGKDSDHNGDPQ